MSDGTIDVGSKKLDTTELTVSGQTVERERVQLGGSTDVALIEPLAATPGGAEYAIPVRHVPSTLPVSGPLTDAQLRAVPVPVSGTVTASGPLTDVQLRALAVPISAASLPLPATASTAALQTQPGVDIGDVTINNAAGAAAVPIQDGGNSITVDALVGTPAFVRLSDGSAAQIGQKVMASSLPVALASDQSALPITDNTGSLTVDAPVATPVFVRLSDGAAAQVGQKVMTASLPVVLASDQSPVNIGTIAGAITPGTAAGNLGKAEDVGHTTGDTGVFTLGVRVDVPNLPTTSPTSGNTDYTAIATDAYGVAWARKRQLVSYSANFRLAETAAQLDLTFTFTANSNKQVATIHHLSTATKTVRLRRVSVMFTTATAAVIGVELRAFSATTAPATGNPAITPRQHDPADGAAEAICLALPTTPGTVIGADNGTIGAHWSINAAATTASVSPTTFGTEEVLLYEYKDGSEMKPPTINAGVQGGYAIIMRSTAATAQRFTALIQFTEE